MAKIILNFHWSSGKAEWVSCGQSAARESEWVSGQQPERAVVILERGSLAVSPHIHTVSQAKFEWPVEFITVLVAEGGALEEHLDITRCLKQGNWPSLTTGHFKALLRLLDFECTSRWLDRIKCSVAAAATSLMPARHSYLPTYIGSGHSGLVILLGGGALPTDHCWPLMTGGGQLYYPGLGSTANTQ